MFRRIADAATESCHGQRVEIINLWFRKRISLVIGRDHLSSSADRVRLIEHHVSQRNGQLANGRRMHHVTIIENRGNSAFRFIHQNVVVVRVVMYDRRAERGEPRDHLVAPGLEDLFNRDDVLCISDVPIEIASCCRSGFWSAVDTRAYPSRCGIGGADRIRNVSRRTF